jgi:hypothetical protein
MVPCENPLHPRESAARATEIASKQTGDLYDLGGSLPTSALMPFSARPARLARSNDHSALSATIGSTRVARRAGA